MIFAILSQIDFHEWANLLVRWAHLLTGIMWIGSSFYFVWLDSALEKPKTPKDGVEGELWMVHSGGFYQVEKRLIRPGELPPNLHWFKWEATFTWITGFILLWIVYYTTGGIYLLDPAVSSITPAQGTCIGIGTLVISWFVYDLIYRSPLSKSFLANVVALLFVGGTTYGLSHYLSGRAMFLHVGAMFGTWMVLNVWVHILPNQQKMIDATQAGKIPDYNLGKIAKKRSMHNSYMTLPVLAIMISNHYSMIYSGTDNWVKLLLLIFIGSTFRVAMLKNKVLPYLPPVIALIILMVYSSPILEQFTSKAPQDVRTIPTEKIVELVQNRCITCHSAHPTDEVFKVAPNGVMFDDFNTFISFSARIKERVIVQKSMPLMNKTHMTDEEREMLSHWLSQKR